IDGSGDKPEVLGLLDTFVTQIEEAVERAGLDTVILAESLPYFSNRSGARFSQCDGDWFYAETYEPRTLAYEHDVLDVNSVKLAFATDFLGSLKHELKNIHGVEFRPSNYYALIAVDGDRMGDRISGRDDVNFDLNTQKALSSALAGFAAAIRI